MPMKRFAPLGLSISGIFLLVVAAIHLGVTTELRFLFLRDIQGEEGRFWVEPFLLNHIVVCILLLPIAITTLFAASAARAGETWGRKIAIVNALSITALPIVLWLMMGATYFRALPFLIATIFLLAAAVLMLICALALKRRNDGD